jgi:hypothetical protein
MIPIDPCSLAELSAYCDALKAELIAMCRVFGGRDHTASLLSSDPRNPERLEMRARHDTLVRLLREDEPMDTITPDASGALYDEESWR